MMINHHNIFCYLAEILQYIGDNIKIKQLEADALYAGIVIDTNNFVNKTGVSP